LLQVMLIKQANRLHAPQHAADLKVDFKLRCPAAGVLKAADVALLLLPHCLHVLQHAAEV
jgi:hypothetical protein